MKNNKEIKKKLEQQYKKFCEHNKEIDNSAATSNTWSFNTYDNNMNNNDTTTHHTYKYYWNIYEYFTRNERRLLKRYGIMK